MTPPQNATGSSADPEGLRRLGRRISELLRDPMSKDVARAFRAYFAFHIALQSLKLPWLYDTTWRVVAVQLVLFASVALAVRRRHAWMGLIAPFAYKGYWVIESFPMTGNHYYAELLILLILLVLPDQSAPDAVGVDDGSQVDGTPFRLIQITIPSIYLFAGVHKLIHGHWLNGEFVTRSVFMEDQFGMWHSTRLLFEALDRRLSATPLDLPLHQPESFVATSFQLPSWAVPLFLAISWTIVLTEVFFPPLLIARRTRRVGIVAVLAMQIGIGIVSWETEFMFGAIGAILLFFRWNPWKSFGTLAVVHAVWSAFVVGSDLRIWEL